MKITISLAVLAVVASQAMAVVPVPIKACTKKVLVTPTDLSCIDFATANGCTFADMLKWNDKLRSDCANLDVGAYLCVSITPGAAGSAGAAGSTTTVAPATTVAPTSAPTTSGAPKAASAPQSTAVSNSTSKPVATPTAVAHANKNNGATGLKSSMAVAAFGILASVAYML
ncbi:hypothetical protein BGZ76_000412 [Entomortierella beljakovae]|nr:hypothetical protein BGZ76_000412 [Entomortierella beljakovae]